MKLFHNAGYVNWYRMLKIEQYIGNDLETDWKGVVIVSKYRGCVFECIT